MDFTPGSKLIYPAHGTAEVLGRTTRTVNGEEVGYVELSVEPRGYGTSGPMKILVPEAKAAELGVRPAISREEAEEVLEVLAVTKVRVPSNWSRRFKNHVEKLKSGDVYQCAEVVRNLSIRERDGRLSSAEQTMQTNARTILVSELAVSWDVPTEEAEARVNAVLAGAGTR